MKRVFKGFFLALPLLVALILVVAFVKIGSLVKTAVETMGPEILQAPVQLEGVSVRPLRGKASLQGLEIGNPEGFRTPHAVKLDELHIDLDIRSLKTDTIRIRGIYIDAPDITLEGLKADNLRQLQENAMAYAGGGSKEPGGETPPPTTPDEPAEKKEAGKKYVIDELVIRAGKINYSPGLTVGQALELTLPEIRVQHIGEAGGGASLAEALGTIFRELEVVLFGTAVDMDKVAASGFRAARDKAAELTGLSTNEVEAGLNEALGKVKGLLGGREGEE